MRHFLRGTAAAGAVLAAAAVPASAADLPVRAAPAPVYAPVAPFTWAGCYVGANAGVAWNGNRDDDHFFGVNRYAGLNPPIVFANDAVGGGFAFAGVGHDVGNDHGFTGGLQVGCNWQAGVWVFGLESDINYIDTGSDDFSFGAAGVTYALPAAFGGPGTGSRQAAGIAVGPLGLPSGVYNAFWSDDHDDHGHLLSTTRVRVGVAFDRFLVYATGGVAFRDGGDDDRGVAFVTNAVTQQNFFGTVVPAGAIATTIGGGPAIYGNFNHDDRNNFGGVAGGGFEWALTNNVSVRVEYLHLFFGGDDNGLRIDPILTSYFGRPIAFDHGNDNDGDVDIVRAGLNIKFGSLFGLGTY